MVHNTIQDNEKIKKMEQIHMTRVSHTDSALSFHLMPPSGWLNDPNGLCQLHGTYHIFFQYSPYSAIGEGDKYWGHYETKDFINYTYTGIFLSPDCDLDKDGVYSGSAFVEDDTMYLYYTGNTMEDGDFDFTYEGRGSNTTLVTSKDGITASAKKCLLTSADYPHTLSCHVRDPKVFKENGKYYMVLGARTRNDVGCVLLYEAEDKEHFRFKQYITSEKPFGYMWECPDLFRIDGNLFLSISPQGIAAEEYQYQNVYQSGYYRILGDLEDYTLSPFIEWDMGFDFYAPQSFIDESGRRILIGWMGIGDIEYENPTVAEGWQHTLTVPRELTLDASGDICQNPVKELTALRKDAVIIPSDHFLTEGTFEMLADISGNEDFSIIIDKGMQILYDAGTSVLSLSFLPDRECNPEDAKGCGRCIRKVKIRENKVSSLQILVDHSTVEIFVNNGHYVFSSRYYKTGHAHTVEFSGDMNITAYTLSGLHFNNP